MSNITAALVKELREKTGVGMMDCKKALTETNGDMEAAADWLRTKGLAKAAKKASRVAAEGLVAVAVDNTGVGGKAAVIELNSETDFVARNDQFQGLVGAIAGAALEVGGDFEVLKASAFPGTDATVADHVTNMVATIGENLSLRRSAGLVAENGVVAAYIHNQVIPNQGKIGVLIALESTGDKAKLEALGRQLAMHIAAVAPLALDTDSLAPAVVEKERAVLIQQALDSGKPQEIAEKMVEGRMKKFYQEVVFLSQTFVIDGENSIRKVLENAQSDIGAPVSVTGFVRLALGEGIEKKEEDFAAEVASVAAS